jgi:hypothetical protein
MKKLSKPYLAEFERKRAQVLGTEIAKLEEQIEHVILRCLYRTDHQTNQPG